jgi:hypothetical protein
MTAKTAVTIIIMNKVSAKELVPCFFSAGHSAIKSGQPELIDKLT